MDNSDLILEPAEAQDAYESMMLHLRCYSWLAVYYFDSRKPLFKMRPKCHYQWHQAKDALAWKLNMNMFHTFSEESFLGRVKAIAVKTHGKTMSQRTLQRYLLFLAVFLNDNRNWICVRNKRKRRGWRVHAGPIDRQFWGIYPKISLPNKWGPFKMIFGKTPRNHDLKGSFLPLIFSGKKRHNVYKWKVSFGDEYGFLQLFKKIKGTLDHFWCFLHCDKSNWFRLLAQRLATVRYVFVSGTNLMGFHVYFAKIKECWSMSQ